MDYRQYDVSEELQPFVRCYWSLDAPATSVAEKQNIVPDGCMEMIFHYGDVYRQHLPDGGSIIQPRSFVFGQIISPLEIEPTGHSGIIAARFHPDGFIPFASIPLEEMKNKAVDLITLFAKEGVLLEEQVLNAVSNEERITGIESFLLNKLQTAEVTDRIAACSVEVLLQTKGQLSVNELSEQLQINRRQLERKFSSVIGLSPKQLSKIIRLQATLKMMEQKNFTSLTTLAYENGYYDQAHFIKDFKEFTGISPKQFYADSLKMSALFIGAA
jgi:AraC-like DNA-binding protein